MCGVKFHPTAVFVARRADLRGTPPGVHVAEGPIDALALVHLDQLVHQLNLAGAAVIGVPAAAGIAAPAVEGWPGPVTLWPDGDGAGERTAARLAAASPGRVRVRYRAAGLGLDVADWARDEVMEREAIRDE